jgi:hypothetical protein
MASRAKTKLKYVGEGDGEGNLSSSTQHNISERKAGVIQDA